MARASQALAAAPGDEAGLDRLARVIVAGLADACAVDLRADDGTLRRVAVAGEPARLPTPDAPHCAGVVMRTGEPELVAAGEGSQLCVPMVGRDAPIGALTLAARARRYGRVEMEVATELARRAAAAIESARSERHYRLLFEQSPLPMWVYDAETLRVLAVNEAAIRHYGYSREEFLAMTIRDIRPPEDVEAMLANIAHRGPGSPVPDTWRHVRKDGTVIDVEISAGRIVFGGRPASLVLAHDVSERKRLEERLTQAEKMEAIGRLAGGVAHDFNNLLTVISGYTSILMARAGGDAPAELREIAHAAEQAAGLTRQLLAFSRRQVLHPRILDLNEIIAGMESMLQRIIGDDVSVGVALADDLAPVEADQAQLERVILNLAANARDAMPRGGRLTIETANVELDEEYVAQHGEGTPGPHVALSISDTGMGMSEETRRHLFEPFFTTKGGGTGLGLATVFGVVKQSGGSIYAYSEEGKGSTFKLYFPAADPARAVAAPAPAARGEERGNETILVVEDDESVRELVRLMLSDKGYRVLTAADAEEAARLCVERPGGVDLLLTDVVMPNGGGRGLADRLEALEPKMRILFMSGYSDEAVYRHGVIRPDAAFIEKPFTERSLTRKVRELLDVR